MLAKERGELFDLMLAVYVLPQLLSSSLSSPLLTSKAVAGLRIDHCNQFEHLVKSRLYAAYFFKLVLAFIELTSKAVSSLRIDYCNQFKYLVIKLRLCVALFFKLILAFLDFKGCI